ncbi:glycosyltransferase family 4 protein [Sanguibacter suarezii]|uniref:glycosyltransferase family 4 protein n=1 Tax=Sanguibacter suarezii TaxID=60921 RepID=UPI00082CDD57|nr:glycosyltransferase family 4 protein [Sanguibacter suarezii]
MRPHTHLITPGDHYSPGTGSAVPTVVHGLSAATPAEEPLPAVLVARGTYPDRYPSAQAIEYPLIAPRRHDRYADLALGRVGLGRPGARRVLAPALTALETPQKWADTVVLAHNLPQAIPLVDSRHVPVLYAHNQLLRTYTARELRVALDPVAVIVCVSTALAATTAEQLPPALRGRVAVVRNGVDAAAFASGPRPQRSTLRVVFIGRTIREKGPDVLVDAVARLGRPDIELLVVGSTGFSARDPLTPYEQGMRRRAVVPGARITFRPFVDRAEIRTILADCDVVVVPSRWAEPSGLTVLEGMAAGAAVIASEVGGIPETAGDAAVLVPPSDVAALAAALEALADDRALLARTATLGRQHAEGNTWRTARDRLGVVLGEHTR